jgi:peptidoglycan/xylan/chitin deacetylase (PgdA/CDA1 family)
VYPNIEFFPLNAVIPRAGASGKIPDVPGWGTRDYGNRIGVFRLIELLNRHGIRGTVALNSDICVHHPQIIEACLAHGWEIMGHNETNVTRLNDVPESEEEGLINRTIDAIEKATGARPKGWLGAGLQETWHTLQLLQQAGIEYVADWCNDDQPYFMHLNGSAKLACVPYSFEINDKMIYEVFTHTSDEFGDILRRQFDALYREGETQARVLPIALHPYLSGAAHRIDALDRALGYICGHDNVWLATGAEIATNARDL